MKATETTAQKHLPANRLDIKWTVLPLARDPLAKVRRLLGEEKYEHEKFSLQEFLCAYFNSADGCTAQTLGIFPLGGRSDAKIFKARWALPGGGKSGGLRLALKVYCNERRVEIAGAWPRGEDPGDAEFERALSD